MKRKESELDSLLQSESQQTVRRLVESLPEESLSMAWRSDLNERLRQTRPRPRWRARVSHVWRPALGLALAGCLAVTVTLRSPVTQSTTQRNLEASLVQAYNDTVTVDDLAGPGLAAREISDTTQASDPSNEWTEADLGTL